MLDAVESVVAETVANAVQATRDVGLDTAVRLTLVADDEGELIVVWDAVPLQPVLNNPDAGCEHSRGLLIVQALSLWFDCRPAQDSCSGGKLVRA